MKYWNTLVCLLAAGTGLAGCGTTSTPALAPYASAYDATYASVVVDAISKHLVNPGDKLEGGAVTSAEAFGGPSIVSLKAPAKVEIEKTADAYILRYAGEEVTFTATDLQTGGFYEQKMNDSSGTPRTIGYLFALVAGTTPDALSAPDSAMVPIGFGVRTNSKGTVTADDADGFSNGFGFVGLETAPSDMPKTGAAVYKGYGRIDAYNKQVDFSVAGNENRRVYSGDSTLEADFGAGTVSGRVDLSEARRRITDGSGGLSETRTDISGQGASVLLDSAAIVQNGFASDLSLNAAAETSLAADGISADTEAVAVGRFYGTGAGEVGAVIAGEGTSHVITGAVTGYKQP
ncbi:transferrin-binding protein-like solute binding protein [Oricola cellulosilytica]|uniref:Transferrin-binding protein B C-lobe/N-lobe beta-barrel domain-containing protein n=1 Tax=Oricola cellulosilytica TaxID=1429082 RepID=A0A4R0PHK8_9HYPH|nr:transferrin-binding protein-like solute binding protein [Oricola cellulosilytica]TCD16254.1 hypothetical protein E0D97_02140 [Oricola cellulosilytica]